MRHALFPFQVARGVLRAQERSVQVRLISCKLSLTVHVARVVAIPLYTDTGATRGHFVAQRYALLLFSEKIHSKLVDLDL